MVDPSQEISGYELTPSAQFALQRWSIEVEKELLLRARLNADRRGSRIVTQEDVFRALKNAEPDFLGEYFKIRRTAFWNATAFIVGIVVSALVAGIFLQGTDTLSQGFAVAGATAGVVALIFALRTWKHPQKISQHDESAVSQEITQWRVMEAWIEIEQAIREITSFTEGKHASVRPVGALIDDFVDHFGLPKEFRTDLRDILRARNSAAHGVNFELSQEHAVDLLNRAEIVIEQIRAKRAELPDQPT